MKQILLMRHAKSSWENEHLQDFERPLSPRGIADAPMMGKFIKRAGYTPEFVIASPAQRAKETLLHVADKTSLDHAQIAWDQDLYFGSVENYIRAIQSAPSNTETIMLVGHNPLMEHTAGWLSGSRERVSFRMPTAAIVCLESYAINWDQINTGTCQVKWMMIPKAIKSVFSD